jgi:hypothetical protein
MNDKSTLNSKDKRASLKRIRNAGLGSAAVATMGLSSGWIRPVVNQVILPAHAVTTACNAPVITAVLGDCSSGAPINITIKSSDQYPLTILSDPTIKATPTTTPHASGDWKTVQGAAPTPIDVTDTVEYFALTRGQMMDEDVCSTPATGVPNSNPVPLDFLELTVQYECIDSGITDSVTVDLLTLI